MRLFVVFLLLTSIRAQSNSCSCTCCRSPGTGQSCHPFALQTLSLQNCVLESCLTQCRATYFQCQGNTLTDYISAECVSTATPQFTCRCDCCNTGFPSCVPLYVGTTNAYSCQTGSCSIACHRQYPNQCKADQTGLTQGICTDFITTTSTTIATIGPWLGNTCKCICCATNSYCLAADVGVTSASSCSSPACTQACRNQYPFSCLSSSSINQISGTCISNIGAKTFCNCRCCETSRCIDYQINTNGGCNTCDSICRQNTPCTNSAVISVLTCATNDAQTIFPWMKILYLSSILTFLSN